ncbi:MAG: response regulator [Pseudomonadota bacterium]
MPESSVKVLVLDDEESIRQSIAAYLEDEGILVFQASSGEEAIDIVSNTPIEAAVVDIRLPGMDGNSFMVKAGQIRPGIRFVVHTGSADYILPESVMAIGVGPENVFIKPVHDLRILMEALKLT